MLLCNFQGYHHDFSSGNTKGNIRPFEREGFDPIATKSGIDSLLKIKITSPSPLKKAQQNFILFLDDSQPAGHFLKTL